MRRGAEALALLLHVGGEAYAVACREVLSVVPRPSLRSIPSAPREVLGVFVFREHVVPVIDLGLRFADTPTPDLLSSRVVLVKPRDRVLGVLAARVSDVVPLGRGTSGASMPTEPSLRGVVLHEGKAIVWLELRGLLSDAVAALLEGAP